MLYTTVAVFHNILKSCISPQNQHFELAMMELYDVNEDCISLVLVVSLVIQVYKYGRLSANFRQPNFTTVTLKFLLCLCMVAAGLHL